MLNRKAPNTTIAEFANTVNPDETAHNEPSHLDLQCLPSSLRFLNIIQFILQVFRNFADVILSSAFLALYELSRIFCFCYYFSQKSIFPNHTLGYLKTKLKPIYKFQANYCEAWVKIGRKWNL